MLKSIVFDMTNRQIVIFVTRMSGMFRNKEGKCEINSKRLTGLNETFLA